MAPNARRSSIALAWAAVILMLGACANGGLSPSMDGSPSASTTTDDSGGTRTCPSAELRGPDGAVPDLSGTWLGLGERNATPWPGTYDFNLLNSCLAWVGRSAEEGEEVGATWTNVFLGRVNPDFTISGDWAVVSTGGSYCLGHVGSLCTQAAGTLVLRIEWVESANGSRVRLVLQEQHKIGVPLGGIGGFVTGIWVRPGDEDLFDLPVE